MTVQMDDCRHSSLTCTCSLHVAFDIGLECSTVCRYWQVIQRSVLLGWTDPARDLLYSHSEGQAVEEELSRIGQVKTWPPSYPGQSFLATSA